MSDALEQLEYRVRTKTGPSVQEVEAWFQALRSRDKEIEDLKKRVKPWEDSYYVEVAAERRRANAAESREAQLREVMLKVAEICENNAPHGKAWVTIGERLRAAAEVK